MFAIVDTFFFWNNYNPETKILKNSRILCSEVSEINQQTIFDFKKYFNKSVCPTLSIIEYEKIDNSSAIKVKYIYNIDRLKKIELLV